MSAKQGDVVVVGAGVIGLAIAFELASRGAAVRVFDRDEPARAASWAAAGMLAPYTEAVASPIFRLLCTTSLREYPAFVARVYAASGVDAQLRLTGIVRAAFDAATAEEQGREADALEREGTRCRVLDRGALLEAEPWLGSSATGGSIVLAEGYVDNRRLGRALLGACQTRGVRIERTSFVRVECDDRCVRGLHTERGFVGAGTVVNACGAWAASLPGVPAKCAVPIEPVKGQMVALSVPTGLVRHATWVPGAYFVPRDDGRLLVGATVERVGFDERITAQGVCRLLQAALAAAPSLSDFALIESWAGLRPSTPDGLPFLGPTPVDGFFLATGHYRNGILLAPITARLIADAIEKKDAAPMVPFAIDRLHTEEGSKRRMTHA